MTGSLESILKTVKKSLLCTAITAGVLLGADTSRADTFWYFTESRRVNQKREEPTLKGQFEKAGSYVSSIGDYSQIDRTLKAPEERAEIKLKVRTPKDTGKNIVEISYLFSENGFQDKIKRGHFDSTIASRRFYRENSAETFIYLAVPRGVQINGCYQEVSVYTHGQTVKREDFGSRIAVPLEESDLGKRIAKFNEALEKLGIKDEENRKEKNSLEENLDKVLEAAPGVIGDIAVILKRGITYSLSEREKKLFEEIQKKYPNHEIHKLPFFQTNGKLLDHTIIGRNFRIGFSQNDVKDTKAYFIVPKISATREIDGDTEIIDLDNLEYEFTLDKPK